MDKFEKCQYCDRMFKGLTIHQYTEIQKSIKSGLTEELFLTEVKRQFPQLAKNDSESLEVNQKLIGEYRRIKNEPIKIN